MAEEAGRPGTGAEPITELVNEVIQLAAALREEGDAIVAPFGLTSARWLILGALQDEPLTAAAIARRRGLSRQSVRESAARLQRDGLIAARPDPTDARAPLLHVTDRGAAALREIEPVRRQWAAAAAAALTDQELTATVSLMQRLRATLSERSLPRVESAPSRDQ
jgi:DNA-binding MarR family transcriptional regulator